MAVAGRLQLTVAILKPDLLARPVAAKQVRDMIIRNNFYIVRSKEVKWSVADAQNFYSEHKGKFFYDRLVSYMCSGPISPMILAHPDAIQHWRALMGPTKSHVARATAPHTVRGMFGLSDTRNSTHGSDSEESARREMVFFFPEFDCEQWYTHEEAQFRNGPAYDWGEPHTNHLYETRNHCMEFCRHPELAEDLIHDVPIWTSEKMNTETMSGLPREVIKWLQSLDLTHPIRNVRRDFSNGYLVAEIVTWYYPQDIQMHSYSNGTSIQTKLGNWQQLERFFGKEGLDISKEFVEGTIHCKPGAAVALLNRLYVLLTKKELHYCPPKGQPEDFSDKTYQSQLPLHARSTAAQSIKNNIACTELTTEPDSILCMQKAQAIIAAHVQQRNQEKEEFPERFGLNVSGNKSKLMSTGTKRSNAAETTEPLEQSLAGIREIKVKQRPPASLELSPPVSH